MNPFITNNWNDMVRSKGQNEKYVSAIIVMLVLLVIMLVLNLLLGSVWVSFDDILAVLFKNGEGVAEGTILIINNFRVPQAITAVISGAGLAVAGLLMQTLFRNPLADPTILGISSGASLGVAILLALSGVITGQALISYGLWSQFGITGAAFLGAFVVLLLIMFLSRRMGSVVSLLIIGIMIAYIAGALVGFVKYYSQREDVHAFVIWGLGSFANVSRSQLPFYSIITLSALALSWLLVKPLNLLLLGDRYAANLGLNVSRNQFYIILLAGFLTAIVTAFAGPIAFIGLAVPHLVRNLLKTADHRRLMPAVMLMGALLALFCNLIARLPGFDGSLPINAVTSLIGAPIVIWIILHRRQLYDTT